MKKERREEKEALYKNFLNILKSLIEAYEALFIVIQNEREALLSSSLPKLGKSNLDKESLISKIEFLERKKTDCVDVLAKTFSVKKKDILSTNIGTYFGEREKEETLKALHFRLRFLIDKINERNLYNKNLVTSALNHVHGAMDSMKSFPYEDKVYERRGSLKRKKFLSGHLISREV